MKKHFVAIALLTVAATVTSCHKNRNTREHYLTAYTSNNEQFYTSEAVKAFAGDNALRIMAISGGAAPEATLFITNYQGAGTYALDGTKSWGRYLSVIGGSMQSVNGIVTITTDYPDVAGSYSFTTGNGVVVTGAFRAK